MTLKKTSLSLIDRAQKGADSAWRELKVIYTPLIYFWCRNSGLAAGDTAEIGANVLGIIFESLGKFEHNGRAGAFRKWLRTITYNEIHDFRRAGKMTAAAQPVVEQAAAEELGETFASEEKAILYHAAWEVIRGEFSDRDNQVFRRIAEGGESAKSVAEDLGLRPSTVYTIVSRIKSRLRERFDGALEP